MEFPVDPSSRAAGSPVTAVLPDDVLRTSTGEPAVLLVRTAQGWTVLSPTGASEPREGLRGTTDPGPDALGLVEAMALADLVAGELGATPEPDRQARRAARNAQLVPVPDDPAPDPRDVEVAALRRTVAQLEHALAARVSIERAIGVLAERHGSTPREAFEDLRSRARSQGRPAAELAGEVLDGLPARPPLLGQHTAHGPAARPPAGFPPPAGQPSSRRVQRGPRRVAGEDHVPEAQS